MLNYVLTAFGNEQRLAGEFQPYTAEEIKAIAGQNLSGKDVYQLRQAVLGQSVAPSREGQPPGRPRAEPGERHPRSALCGRPEAVLQGHRQNRPGLAWQGRTTML